MSIIISWLVAHQQALQLLYSSMTTTAGHWGLNTALSLSRHGIRFSTCMSVGREAYMVSLNFIMSNQWARKNLWRKLLILKNRGKRMKCLFEKTIDNVRQITWVHEKLRKFPSFHSHYSRLLWQKLVESCKIFSKMN